MMQEKNMSCGPACVAMPEVYSKSRFAANIAPIARAISQKYDGRFKEYTSSILSNLASILRARGVSC